MHRSGLQGRTASIGMQNGVGELQIFGESNFYIDGGPGCRPHGLARHFYDLSVICYPVKRASFNRLNERLLEKFCVKALRCLGLIQTTAAYRSGYLTGGIHPFKRCGFRKQRKRGARFDGGGEGRVNDGVGRQGARRIMNCDKIGNCLATEQRLVDTFPAFPPPATICRDLPCSNFFR